MAVTNYQPSIWHGSLLENLHQSTFVIPTLNHDYEGDIANGGETVKITGFTTPTIGSYAGSITRQVLTDSNLDLAIDQKKYYAYLVDDVDKVQSAGSFDAVQRDAAAALADTAENYVLTDMLTNGTSAGTTAVTTFALADAAVKAIRTALVKAKVPATGRYLAVNPEAAGFLMDNGGSLFKANEAGSDATLRQGVIGQYRGFTVIETPSSALANSAKPCFVGYWGRAYGFAEQLVKSRAQTVTDAFGDQVDGLHVYGGKVIRATAVQTYVSA
ncbi:MAG: hypothetical protein KDB30_13385 [Tetrasphaera sp.]|nr:hypothetical protein [Tetrasphaera sp.]